MKSCYLSFIFCLTACSIFSQSPSIKDAMLVVSIPTDSTAKGSVLVADSAGHAKWEQPGYVKTDSTFTISEDNKLVVENTAHIKGVLRIGHNSIYLGAFLPKIISIPDYDDYEDVIITDGPHDLQISPSPARYNTNIDGNFGYLKLRPTANTLINPDDGTVGIGTRSPDAVAKLDVNGLLKTTSLKIPGGQEGKILTSDNAGLARWENLSNLSGNNYWYKNGNSVGTATSVVIGQDNVSASAPLDLKTQSGDKVLIGNGGDASISFLPLSSANNSWFHLHHTHRNTFQISQGNLPGTSALLIANSSGKITLGTEEQDLKVGLDVRVGDGKIAAGGLYLFPSSIAPDGLPYARLVESWGMKFDSPDKRWVLSTSGSFLAGYQPQGSDWGTGNIYASGNVGIGTTDTKGYKLAVNGKILSKGLKVQIEGWSDFVFDKNYPLATLEETETYILHNKHLKDVPSEKEVIANGIEVGEMNKILLQKIEELTLQLIQLNKKVNQIQKTTK